MDKKVSLRNLSSGNLYNILHPHEEIKELYASAVKKGHDGYYTSNNQLMNFVCNRQHPKQELPLFMYLEKGLLRVENYFSLPSRKKHIIRDGRIFLYKDQIIFISESSMKMLQIRTY